MRISGEDFERLFTGFQREAFRLETLDDYTGSSHAESIRAFLAGEPQPEDYNQEWADEVRSNVDSGKRMYRVHILSRPLTPYLRFELGWGYTKNARSGEEFFILDTTEQPNPLEGVPDFWLFDETTTVTMEYGPGGSFIGADSRPIVADYLEYRDVALSHAEPFAAWWERYGSQ
ncbi:MULTISPECIES: DUF6879 family protein [Kitasatospora]|uniref:DUF6879 domain-containing protein n=1 Tax=Kitasatospora setae (strain ATCC 33774 / DSM 43861 / JCM 3304 / KCC A-0304 / NBRC 14216 / KM-6054) TaxID=452652 RepID=E4N3Y6_KITSK|nr:MULTISPECIES: DUF6879 family protein [Kitasatospora]BAJ31617.1 hypothetical protein KSE_58470 [Kitasatospora setae KM-6054]